MNQDKIVIFLQSGYAIGGIETIIYNYIKWLKSLGNVKVICVKSSEGIIDDFYSDVINERNVLICNGIHWKLLSRHIGANTKVVQIVAFSLTRFLLADSLKNRIHNSFPICEVNSFYFIPNFKGFSLYPDDAYKGLFRRFVNAFFTKIYKRIFENNSLRICSNKHYEKIYKSYGVETNEVDSLFVPSVPTIPHEFNLANVKQIWSRDSFNILSISRLDFPHKGYVLGLVRSYEKLKLQFPRITLTIVGDGNGMYELKEIINSFSKPIQESIFLIGKVSPNNLSQYYDNCNILVSVAGCLSKGAERGLLCLPARHYNTSCEVYGFLPETADYVVSDMPGESIEEYLKKAINMTENEYINQRKLTYEYYTRKVNIASKRADLLSISNKSKGATINTCTKFFALILLFFGYIRSRI